jgi:hypothetical protein
VSPKKLENIILSEVGLAQKIKIVCSPSYADIRSRANTTRGLDFDHMIKESAHKGDMRIGKTPKKLVSICCTQCRETTADTLKATEANRRRGPGTREKVRSRRINLGDSRMAARGRKQKASLL